jgi:hypothetical protein
VPDAVAGPVRLFDADRDGDLDAIVPGASDALWLNDGRGAFADVTAAEAGGRVFGDLDGDGFLDSLDLVDGPFQEELRLYFNEGTGVFRDASSELPAVPAGFPALADLDGNGALDVYVSSFPQASLLLNDGAGTLVEAPGRLPPSSSMPSGYQLVPVAFLDLDVDGDLDLYRMFSLYHEVLLNDGTAHFTSSTPPGIANDLVRFGDVDGDGDPDVVVVQRFFPLPPLPPCLLRNQGDGSFVEDCAAFAPFPNVPSVSTLALADLDGDGDLDVVTAANSVYRNSGSGTFQLSGLVLPFAPGWMLDYDDDGDVDVLNGEAVARNEGEGRFTVLPFCLPAFPVGDVDADGDRDIPGEYGLERALAWHSLPRLGRRLVLELYGPPQEPFVLFASPVRRIRATGLGLLQLDPEHAVRAAMGELDDTGRTELAFEVPSTSELAGRTLYWQALVGSSPRLTNLEATTFRDL